MGWWYMKFCYICYSGSYSNILLIDHHQLQSVGSKWVDLLQAPANRPQTINVSRSTIYCRSSVDNVNLTLI